MAELQKNESLEKKVEVDGGVADNEVLITANEISSPSRCIYCHADYDEPIEALYNKEGQIIASYHSICKVQFESSEPLELETRISEGAKKYKKFLRNKSRAKEIAQAQKDFAEEHANLVQYFEAQKTICAIADTYKTIQDVFGVSELSHIKGWIEKEEKFVKIRVYSQGSGSYTNFYAGAFPLGFNFLLPLVAVAVPFLAAWQAYRLSRKNYTVKNNLELLCMDFVHFTKGIIANILRRPEMFSDNKYSSVSVSVAVKNLEPLKELQKELSTCLKHFNELAEKYECEELETKIQQYLAEEKKR